MARLSFQRCQEKESLRRKHENLLFTASLSFLNHWLKPAFTLSVIGFTRCFGNILLFFLVIKFNLNLVTDPGIYFTSPPTDH
jgi:hypothetical protein